MEAKDIRPGQTITLATGETFTVGKILPGSRYDMLQVLPDDPSTQLPPFFELTRWAQVNLVADVATISKQFRVAAAALAALNAADLHLIKLRVEHLLQSEEGDPSQDAAPFDLVQALEDVIGDAYAYRVGENEWDDMDPTDQEAATRITDLAERLGLTIY